MVRILGVCLMLSTVEGKDFGIQGTTYPVSEDSLLEHLRQQLSKLPPETLHLKQLEVQERVKQSALHPIPVTGIHKATTFRTVTFDPSITVDKNILDHQGNIIAAKGSTVNPLATLHLKDQLLLFDGTDPEQVAWAAAKEARTKWILTAGSPFDLMKLYDRVVYFDQGGTLCKHFKITGVAALIRQKGPVLEIERGLGDEHAH